MTKKCRVFCTLMLAGMLSMTASADILVDLNPWDAYINGGVGDTVMIDIIACIPEQDAILGWGLDFVIDDAGIAEVTGVDVNTALFNAVETPDGDYLGGLAFPDCVWGDDVLLATVEVTATGLGESDIYMWDNNPDDLTEGFALCNMGFANVCYSNGWVTVTPEPASLSLLAVCGLLALRRR